MELFVSNIAYAVTEDQLSDVFKEYGEVESCRIIKDRETGRSRGYGFIRMPENEKAATAVEALNGQHLAGRALTVRVSVPKARPEGERGGHQHKHGAGKRGRR